MRHVSTPEEAGKDPGYADALKELLYQLADDDFIVSFRGSEWLGLAPHIEEDVSFSSITQNTMGHAVMFYQLLEELGEKDADVLAHERKAEERRNAVYLEKKNGEGTYLEEPHYDWALTVIRHFLYETWKKIRLEAVTKSSYEPLALTAQKVLMEQTYHLAHWRVWVEQLQKTTEEAVERLQQRLTEAWDEILDMIELGPKAADMNGYGLIAQEKDLQERWLNEVKQIISLSIPAIPGKAKGSGRACEHTPDLDQALAVLSEVYDSDKEAMW